MKRYWILWTYIANYNSIPLTVDAESPELAAERVFDMFGDEFREKATVNVFDNSPVAVFHKGVVDAYI